jgi:hypothetical protein
MFFLFPSPAGRAVSRTGKKMKKATHIHKIGF